MWLYVFISLDQTLGLALLDSHIYSELMFLIYCGLTEVYYTAYI